MAINKPPKSQLIQAVEDWVGKAVSAQASVGAFNNAEIQVLESERDKAREACLQLIENLYSFS